MEAVFITATVFLILSIFTLQSKWDFSFLGAGLGMCLWILILWGFFGIIFGLQTGSVYALLGSVVFSLYIIYDTYMIAERMDPEDYVIATGVQYSVRDFVNTAAQELGMSIRWEGEGIDEKGYWSNRHSGESRNLGNSESPIVAIDPRYFRPTEVETLLGDPSKAMNKLGWKPTITFKELVAEMVREDLKDAERDELIKRHGYSVFDYNE